MLKRANRLSEARIIKRLYQKGRSASSSFFRIVWQFNRSNNPRIAIVIGAKFSKRAVKRNLIKRRIRTVIVANIVRLEPADLIIQPKLKSIELFTFDQIRQDLERLLIENRLMRN